MPELAKALMTAIYPVTDLATAKRWYAGAFGVEPYFDEPFYVGFSVAGYELGLVPQEAPLHQPGNRGVIVYWGVENADAAWRRVTQAGAKTPDPVHDLGARVRG